MDYDTLICKTAPAAGVADGNTPNLDSISQTIFTIIGGEEFTLTGSGLMGDCDSSQVLIGSGVAEIISWTAEEIVAVSPQGLAMDIHAETKVNIFDHVILKN